MEKYTIFHIDGGIGKHIAATAVAKCIKNNYPDHKLIIVCAWPSIFLNLDYVHRVYRTGLTPYFYKDYILDAESVIFKHEPYFTTDHIYQTKDLISNWCELYRLEYGGEQPSLVFNLREQQLSNILWPTDKPPLVMHSSGGLFNSEQGFRYKWTRDIPIGIMNKIAEEFSPNYSILQVTREGSPVANGAIPIVGSFSPVELCTILINSKKRVLIDSMLQHAAAALQLPSTVLWIGTNPKVFGYSIHDNIVANQKPEFKLPDSYLFDYNFEGLTHECPYISEDEMFNVDDIISSIKKQSF